MALREVWGRATGLLGRHQKDQLGMHIEPHAFRVVHLKTSDQEHIHLLSYDVIDGNIFTLSAEDRKSLGALLREKFSGMKRVAFAIEHPTLRIRRMNLPPMPDSDLMEAIRWNFREHVECPIEKYSVGYTKLPGFEESGKAPVVAYGVSDEAIHEYIQLAKDLGMKLISLEPAPSALLASFQQNHLLEQGKYTVCLFLGETQSYFTVMTAGIMLFSRPLPSLSFSGFTKLVQQNLQKDEGEAQKLVQEFINMPQPQEEKKIEENTGVAGVYPHFLSQMVIEIQRSIDAFCIMYDANEIHALYLCGEGVRLPQLAQHIQHSLGMDVSLFEPFAAFQLQPSSQDEHVKVERASFAVATGLALPSKV